MVEPLIVTSSLLIGREVFTNTISSTTKSIYKGIDNIIINDNLQFKELLDELDINTKLDVINTFITDIHNEQHIFNNTLNKTFKYLEDILNTINNEIKNINIELINHKEKWFNKLRSSSYHIMINNLIKHIKILDKRFNLLIKLISI